MRSRTLKVIAIVVALLAGIDLALTIPALRAAHQLSDPPFHNTYVRDFFGFPWWVLPTALLLVAIALFIWSRRITAHANAT